jgi:predicted ATPase
MGSTDNVVEFLVAALGRLPENTLKTINLAACFGNTFDARFVSECASLPLQQVESNLWHALRSGKIFFSSS